MSLDNRLRPYLPYMHAFGIRKGFSLPKQLFPKGKTSGEIQVNIPQVKTPIHLRIGGSDVTNFLEVFMNREFILPKGLKPELIIDAGANVGMASLVFLNNYPGAKVIAIEPDGPNCEMIRKNCQSYPGMEILQTGIWAEDGHCVIENPDAASTAFRLKRAEPSDAGSFPVMTIGTVLKQSGKDRIGILKLDIEGAEAEVFQENYKEWIDKVDVLIIELHDRLKKGCSVAFYSAIEQEPFSQFANGENMIYVRNPS